MSQVTLHTNNGDITLKLFPDKAPKACENFSKHAKDGYYDKVIFHRVIEGFMIQGGDPTGTGRGGKSIWGKNFEDETHPSLCFDRKGLLAMANAGPCTNGSQFFITLAPTAWLNGKHTIFGEVVHGMDVVEAIAKCAKGPGDKPLKDVVIERCTVV
ncbi:MAG: peptidylprolyl isomerase [Acidobacteria bacterium]|nr:peptidylprolyl isomerase [Acidobacteriota bacterium]